MFFGFPNVISLSRGSTDEYRLQSPSKDAGKSESRAEKNPHKEEDQANVLEGFAGQPESFGRFSRSHRKAVFQCVETQLKNGDTHMVLGVFSTCWTCDKYNELQEIHWLAMMVFDLARDSHTSPFFTFSLPIGSVYDIVFPYTFSAFLGIFHGKLVGKYTSPCIDPIPDTQCMVYLPTFTIKS